MSEIRANTIANAAGTGPAELTGQLGIKASALYDQTGTLTVNDSFNVSSITDSGTGHATTDFTNAFSDALLALGGQASNTGTDLLSVLCNVGASTTQIETRTASTASGTMTTATYGDRENCAFLIDGDLA